MIWNDATDVRLNGATVQAVFCNNQMVWPSTTAEPDAWTMMIVSSYNGNLYESEVGFDIFDATHRKVYSTNGMHPVSSYELTSNCIYVSASGVSPFKLHLSSSGSPYKAFLQSCPQFISDTPIFSGSGSFISASGIMADSLKNSAKFPTAMEDPSAIIGSNTTVSRAYVREYSKQIWVYGSAFSQYDSSVQASMFLFTPTAPISARLGGGSTFTATAVAPTSYTENIKAGYFNNYSASMTRKDDSVNAFDMFNGIEHSGDVYMWVKGTTLYQTHTNTSDRCTISIFPSTLVSGTYPENQYLSGGKLLTPTSVAKATRYGSNGTGTMYATFTDDASDHAYVGVYCTDFVTSTAVCSANKLTCSATALQYTASTYVP